MKSHWLIWGTLFILSLVAISFYGGPISYGFFFATLLTVPLALIYLGMVYIFFRIYQRSDGVDLTVNETRPFFFSLVNDYFFPFVSIRVRFFSSFSTITGLDDQTEYELMPHEGITKETGLVCKYRGVYEVGIRSVEFTDFLRLFTIRYRNKETKKVKVYPQLVYLSSLGNRDIAYAMRDSKANPEEPDAVSRVYMPGDDVRLINWAQSARSSSVMLRERIGAEMGGITVLMDSCRYSDDEHRYLPLENKVLELTIALTLYLSGRRISVTQLYLAGQLQVVRVANSAEFESYYQKMSGVVFTPTQTTQRMAQLSVSEGTLLHSSMVYMVLASWDAYTEQLVYQLAQSDISCMVYLVSDDTYLYPHLPDPVRMHFMRISPEDDLKEVFG